MGALAILILCIAAVLIQSAQSQSPLGEATLEVGVAKVELRKIAVANEFVGRIDASENVEVRARIEGFLDKQLFQDGTVVKQGELLFIIDPREYEAAVGAAKARLAKARADLASAKTSVVVIKAKADLTRDQATLANAEKDLARVKPLAEASAVSIQELDQADTKAHEAAAVVDASKAVVQQSELNRETNIALAEADVQQTSAALTTALLNLSYTKVMAPISGRIGKAAVNVGSLVGKGENSLLATVSRLDPIYAYFSVSEQQYLAVAHAMDLNKGEPEKTSPQFELILANGETYNQKGRLNFIDRAVDPKTGTLQARAVFPNPTQLLRPGQFARVRATNPEAAPTLVIPQRAVIEQQGEQFVMVVDAQGKVERRKVKLGTRIDASWVVNEGLKEGEQVITDGLQKARPGMTVRILKSNP